MQRSGVDAANLGVHVDERLGLWRLCFGHVGFVCNRDAGPPVVPPIAEHVDGELYAVTFGVMEVHAARHETVFQTEGSNAAAFKPAPRLHQLRFVVHFEGEVVQAGPRCILVRPDPVLGPLFLRFGHLDKG